MGFAVVASAGAAAGAPAAGAATARPEGLETGAGRAGGASGVVAMTWISGRLTELAFVACCATAPKGIVDANGIAARSRFSRCIDPAKRPQPRPHSFAPYVDFAIIRRM